MHRIYFVTGTDTGVGKTWCSVILVRALTRRGARVAVMKPVACGSEVTAAGRRNSDALELMAASNVIARYEQVNPYCLLLPASPHLAAEAEGVSIDLAVLERCATELARRADVLVIEGAGGWLAPIDRVDTMAAVARSLRAAVILVVGLRLGCLNHALLTAGAVRASGLELAGWIANHVAPGFEQADANVDTLRRRLGAPLLGVIGHGSDREAAARSLDTTFLDVAGEMAGR
jgi:dethiobiotin synthetase